MTTVVLQLQDVGW